MKEREERQKDTTTDRRAGLPGGQAGRQAEKQENRMTETQSLRRKQTGERPAVRESERNKQSKTRAVAQTPIPSRAEQSRCCAPCGLILQHLLYGMIVILIDKYDMTRLGFRAYIT